MEPALPNLVEQRFEEFLDRILEDPEASFEDFLLEVDEELRSALRSRYEDYRELRHWFGGKQSEWTAGTRLGDFELIRLLGSGGMGQVWEAKEGRLDRLVAVKLLPSPDSPVSARRWKRIVLEAQASARIRHPGIVQIFAYKEEQGIHFLVMELVPEGKSLAREIVDARAFAELPKGWIQKTAIWVLETARALEAAHQAGVIHRDVKPSNILLNEAGHCKVSDFGMAKLEEGPGLSRTGEYPGTPFYTAPEILRGPKENIGPISDVFSLGATFYELLTLERAFAGDSVAEVYQQIVLRDPPDPRKIRRAIPEELAAVCLKALEKDPRRRYRSAAEVADELQRWLKGETVLAKTPGPFRRSWKWAKRHPLWTGFALMAVAFSLSLMAMFWHERQTRIRAERAVTFLEGLFATADPGMNPSQRDAVGELLDQRAEQLRKEFQGDPEIQVRLLLAIGQANAAFGRPGEAEKHFRACLDIGLPLHGPSHPEILAARNELAVLFETSGRYHEAEATFQQILEGLDGTDGLNLLRLLSVKMNLGLVAFRLGKVEASIEMLEAVLDDYLNIEPYPREEVEDCQHNLASICRQSGKLQRAETLATSAWESRRRYLGEDHPKTLSSLHEIGAILETQGQPEVARERYRQALQLAERRFRTDHPLRMRLRGELARVSKDLGDVEEADQLYTDLLVDQKRSLGLRHRETLKTQRNLGFLKLRLEQDEQALSLFLEVVTGLKADLPQDPERARCLTGAAICFASKGEFEQAEPFFREAAEIAEAVHGFATRQALGPALNLASVWMDLGRREAAANLLKRIQNLETQSPELVPIQESAERMLLEVEESRVIEESGP
ncbi:MAG: serine/threonine protein kinase [Planctomycetota bacterium]|nr:MAG: serine/threonine protein kinase [Planctomycetota bacterium]